ncbi:hypothetical protein G5I_04790 [Acromyrmex echinatior]|uniref:Uncharacterized protein n=1 Tax=Acromyrmex echinatior TaxID=103372 RepID=F4WGK8_ACREC|nr:hypothetical protein G5I_04790 [Acromyrmex echinatior]
MIERNDQLSELKNLFSYLEEHRSLKGYDALKTSRRLLDVVAAFTPLDRSIETSGIPSDNARERGTECKVHTHAMACRTACVTRRIDAV